MAYRYPVLALILAALASVGCSSPTEPEPTYVLSVGGDSATYARLSTQDGQPAIVELQVLLDGEDVSASTYKFSPAVASLLFAGNKFGVRRGHHTVAVRLISNSGSPTVCVVSDLRVLLQTMEGLSFKTLVTVVLPGRSVALMSGESVVYEVDV